MQVVAVNSSAPIAGAAVVAGLILVAYRRAAKKKYPSEDEIDPREIE
jgi:nitrate reductase gamma subunit